VVSTVATTSTATSTTGASATIKPLISTSLLALAPYSRGDQVLALQNSLIKYGYLASGLNTGYLGPLTQAAIAKYKAVLASVSSGISSANAPATGTTTASVSYFTRKLKVGSIGSDVRALQVFLNAHGFRVASSGNGSVGHESTYYGTATAAAVSRFQIAHASDILAPYGLTAGTGNFGAATMKVVNGME
jgi:peptidoglycan hydrolase-like protein with peptidoglycan-binding domain